MTKYVFKDGKFVDPSTGAPMVTQADKARFKKMLADGTAPQIRGDIPDYISPVTGKLVSGRVQRREDLKRNDCYEIDPPSKPLRERHKRKEIEIKNEPDPVLDAKLEAVLNR